jgi:hypothetical protein
VAIDAAEERPSSTPEAARHASSARTGQTSAGEPKGMVLPPAGEQFGHHITDNGVRWREHRCSLASPRRRRGSRLRRSYPRPQSPGRTLGSGRHERARGPPPPRRHPRRSPPGVRPPRPALASAGVPGIARSPPHQRTISSATSRLRRQ